MKVCLYARVSTKHQDVEQQMEQLRKWAVKNDCRIVHEIWDEESAAIDLRFRQQFKNILKNPIGEALVIFNLDRLTRNWYDENELEKYFIENWNNFKLISMHDEINLNNASGRAMFRMKMVMNCFMPEDMKEKQIIGIDRAKAQGKYKGRKKGALGKNKPSSAGLQFTSPYGG